MSRPIDPIEDTLWRYGRGDLDEAAFEAWAYGSTELEAAIGEEDYIALISADYRDATSRARSERAWRARDIAGRHFPRECHCLSLGDTDRVFWGGDNPNFVGEEFVVLARRTPWIQAQCCKDCGTHWLVGIDGIDDQFLLRRLSATEVETVLTHDNWPDAFADRPGLVPDKGWLRSFGYASLEDWRAAEDPLRKSGVIPPG